MSSVNKYHKSCSELIWPFYSLLQLYAEKLQKSHISVSSVHKYHKSCSQLIWPFYSFFELYELKHQKSHLREFSAQISQIVFWAHLTVLRIITTVWGKTSEISNFREFSAQVSQIFFSDHLIFLRRITIFNLKLQKSHISVSSKHKYHKSCSQLIWPF